MSNKLTTLVTILLLGRISRFKCINTWHWNLGKGYMGVTVVSQFCEVIVDLQIRLADLSKTIDSISAPELLTASWRLHRRGTKQSGSKVTNQFLVTRPLCF
ncbi:hypothetical protein J6590_015867 [Homalodisca vitripennis]|nr:hypothetical protein J6590_015867 [Homalodisca vitripennis]